MSQYKGRVLIFDDDPVIGRTLGAMVKHLEMDATSVTESETFFRAVDHWDPTHIILDLHMPDMDGVEVLQQLAGRGCKAKIAISSGVGVRVLNASCLSAAEHGLAEVESLPKPLRLNVLQEFLFSGVDKCEAGAQRVTVNSDITRSDLQSAIERREFCLVYQPKIDCRTRHLKGFETLVRWNHPEKGLIMPDRFITLAEKLGLIGPITEQVVEQAFSWYQKTPKVHGLSIAINISAYTLGDVEFANWLYCKCSKAGIPNEYVVLEVTETAAMVDQLLALDLFTRLRIKGFQVSIDDFGIGHSSLAMLARLPFSEVKIDKSFGIKAHTCNESRAIIKSTVKLGHSLNLNVVAEGVENEELLSFLQDLDCDLAQGYHIARPMPGNQIVDWMSQAKCTIKPILI